MDTNKSPEDFGCVLPCKITKEFIEYCKKVALFIYSILTDDKENPTKKAD
jgi:hypothetical protein